jgi:hypothetical protein
MERGTSLKATGGGMIDIGDTYQYQVVMNQDNSFKAEWERQSNYH